MSNNTPGAIVGKWKTPSCEKARALVYGKEKLKNNTLDTTVSEWQAEMDKFAKGDPGKTISELMKDLEKSKYTTRLLVLELMDSGRCTQGTGVRIDSSGRRQYVTVYQLISKKEKE